MTPPSTLRIAAVLAATLVTSSCERRQPPLAKGVELPPATRVMVLAGDSLVVDGRHIKIANIESPQSIPDARCWAEAVSAKYAIQVVKELVRDARSMRIQPTGNFDSYGRTEALVSLDGLDLGQALYDAGGAAKPKDGVFRWCEQVSRELDGAPTWGSLSEPGR